MLLAAGLLIEFAKFLQIMSWIVLPVFLSVVIVTIVLHYRRKSKKETLLYDPIDDLLLTPGIENDKSLNKGAYLFFDHSGLVKQYQQKLTYNQARYLALKNDYEKLQHQYSAHLHPQQLQSSYQQLFFMKDNNQATLPEMEQFQNEFTSRQQQQYLQDMLQEKEAQVNFLQQQLEQRIKNFHCTEQTNDELNAQLVLQQQEFETKNELIIEQSQLLEDKEKLLLEKQQEVLAKNDQIIYLENAIKELREQNELLNAAVADEHQHAMAIQQQLEEEQSRTYYAEQHLFAKKQLIQRLYKEISLEAEVENAELSPVVLLTPAYSNKEGWDEKVFQS